MPKTRHTQPQGTTTALSQQPELIQLVRLLARQAARETVQGTTQQEPGHDQDQYQKQQDPDQD
jgi:hypothetical protein